MEEVLCSVCKRVMSPRELGGRGQIPSGGEVICSQCLGKMRELAPVQCHRCSAKMPPVTDGRRVLCRKCGADLGRAENGHPVSGPAAVHTLGIHRACPYCGGAVRPDALRCSSCGSSLAPGEREVDALLRRNRHLSLALGALGAFCVVIVLGIVLILTMYFGVFGARTVPIVQVPAAPTEAVTPEAPTPEIVEQPALSESDVKAMIDKAVGDTRQTLSSDVQALQTELTALRKELKEGLAAIQAPPVLPPMAPTRPPVAPTPDEVTQLIQNVAGMASPAPIASPKAPTPAGESIDARAKAFYTMAKNTADAFERAGNYGGAMKSLEAFPDKYKATPWQKEIEAAKAALKIRAELAQKLKFAEAEALLRAGDVDGARQVHQWLADNALPDAAESARKSLEAIDIALAARQERLRATTERRAQINSLILQLRDLQNPLRSEAALKLGEVKAREAVPDLIATLKDTDWFLVVRAARALGEVGDPAAIPALIDTMSNRFPAVATAASEALQKLSGQSFGEDQLKWRGWWEENKQKYPAAG